MDVKCPAHRLAVGPRNLVVNMGLFPNPEAETGEDEFIRVIRKKIPLKYLPNIADMKASQNISRKGLPLPQNTTKAVLANEPQRSQGTI